MTKVQTLTKRYRKTKEADSVEDSKPKSFAELEKETRENAKNH
jgi:hypothetical protein